MKIDIKQLALTLNKLDVSVSQFFFLMIVHDRRYASLYMYESNNVGFTPEELNDLIDKGYLTKISEEDKYADNYETTEKFRMALFNENEDGPGEELWDKFPPFINIGGKRIPAKTVDKEKFIKDYWRKVGRYQIHHQTVMEALDFGIKNNMICMGLEKWFLSEQWNEILKEKEKIKVHGHFPSEHVF